MVIEPLDNLPLIRDLVIDRTRYEENLIRMVPEMQRGEPYPGFPELITPREMGHAPEMMHCIDCLICLSVCPAYGDEYSFVGPAPLVQLARFALDPRDDGPRAALAVDEASIQGCVNCYECTENCPAGIDILEHAIDPLRKRVVDQNLGIVAHHNKVYKELVLEQGIVNPSTLLFRSRGWKVISEFDLAIRMWLKGRITFGKLTRGLMGQEKLDTQEELIKLAQAVQINEDEKVKS
jgi:Fe-S oxidoreductase